MVKKYHVTVRYVTTEVSRGILKGRWSMVDGPSTMDHSLLKPQGVPKEYWEAAAHTHGGSPEHREATDHLHGGSPKRWETADHSQGGSPEHWEASMDHCPSTMVHGTPVICQRPPNHGQRSTANDLRQKKPCALPRALKRHSSQPWALPKALKRHSSKPCALHRVLKRHSP